MFNALRESRGAARDSSERRDAHLIKERNSQRVGLVVIALLEAIIASLKQKQNQSLPRSLRLKPMRRICADKMTYAEYLRMASRSEPFILMTGAPMPSSPEDESNKVPGVPRWSHKRLREACAGRRFSLKVVEDDPQKAQRMWARMKVLKEVTMDAFLDVMEGKGDKHLDALSDIHDDSASKDLREAYLHDAPLNRSCPELLDDVLVPSFFARDLMQRTDLHTDGTVTDILAERICRLWRPQSALHADW